MIHDFLREVFPRSGDCDGAQVQRWLEVEVLRLADIGWIPGGRW